MPLDLSILSTLVDAGLLDAAMIPRIERNLDETVARKWAESRIGLSTQAGLYAQMNRIVETEMADSGAMRAVAKWKEEDTLLYNAMSGALLEVASERAAVQSVISGQFDTFHRVNENVVSWVEEYYQ